MSSRVEAPYRKYFYWVDPDMTENLEEKLISAGYTKKVFFPRERPCESLHHSKKISIVPPISWNQRCYRQGSWYRSSEFNGLSLLISELPIPEIQYILRGRLTILTPDRNPEPLSNETIVKLRSHSEYHKMAPKEWFQLLPHEIPLFQRFIDRYNLKVSLEEFVDRHNTNHANFLPHSEIEQYCLLSKEKRIPCSLYESNYVCSACVELFGIIGVENKRMALKKCPGLKYIDLSSTQYILTEFIT